MKSWVLETCVLAEEMMKPTAEQTAAIKAANEILAKAGLPKYQPRLYPTLELEGR
jgi:hypothetical protein